MKKYVVVLLAFLLIACAQRIIVQDNNGVLLPQETVTMRNPDKGIEVRALFLRMVEVSPESFYPEYLKYDKINKLSFEEFEKTKEVILFVRVTNPQKQEYKIWKRIRYGEGPEDFDDKLLYKGKEEVKHFQMNVPRLVGKMYQVMAVLQYGDGFPMMHIGYFDVLYRERSE